MFHKLVFRKWTRKKMYLKTYLSNTPNTVDQIQIQIQIQIHGLKFGQIQIQIQIRRICICICICKYKYVFDPSPATFRFIKWQVVAVFMNVLHTQNYFLNIFVQPCVLAVFRTTAVKIECDIIGQNLAICIFCSKWHVIITLGRVVSWLTWIILLVHSSIKLWFHIKFMLLAVFLHITVDSRYLALVGSQNSRARVKWFSRYLALSREGVDSRIQDHRPTFPGVYNSQTVCWAIIEVLTFPGSLHTSTSHQRQITTSNIIFW